MSTVLYSAPGRLTRLSAFLVERDRPGFRLGDVGTQSGLHGFSFGDAQQIYVPAGTSDIRRLRLGV